MSEETPRKSTSDTREKKEEPPPSSSSSSTRRKERKVKSRSPSPPLSSPRERSESPTRDHSSSSSGHTRVRQIAKARETTVRPVASSHAHTSTTREDRAADTRAPSASRRSSKPIDRHVAAAASDADDDDHGDDNEQGDRSDPNESFRSDARNDNDSDFVATDSTPEVFSPPLPSVRP